MTFTLGALANARTPWEAIATQARAIQEVQDDGGERKANEGRTSLFKSTMSLWAGVVMPRPRFAASQSELR